MAQISAISKRAPMPASSAMTAGAAPEYAIYTFDRAEPGAHRPRWQKHHIAQERHGTLKMARHLFASGEYARVEVTQKRYDRRAKRFNTMTLAAFDVSACPRPETRMALALGLSMLFGMCTFLAACAMGWG